MNKHSRYHRLGLILVVSILLRVGVALYLGNMVDAPPLLTDQRSYHTLATSLLAGEGYSFPLNWYPFTPANTPTAHWSFLYPVFVAGIYGLVGPHPLAARLVQAVLTGVLLPWLVYRLAQKFTPFPPEKYISVETEHGPVRATFTPNNDSVATGHNPVTTIPVRIKEPAAIPLIAAALAAWYPYFVLYAATLMTESFYLITLLWSLAVGLKLEHRLRAGQTISPAVAVQLGLSLGITALLRQSILPWVPVLGLWLLWQARQRRQTASAARSLLLTGLVIAALILPWTSRNYRVFGQFLLLNSNAGYAMYSAQHPMHGTNFHEYDAAPLPKGWWGRPEPELDRDLMQLGLGFVLADPQRYFLLTLSRTRAFFECWPTPGTTLLHNLGRTASFGLLLPFIAYGLYRLARRRELRTRYSLLLLFAGFYTLLHLFTWAMVRYRLPVDAVLMPPAALGLVDLYTLARRRLAADLLFSPPLKRTPAPFLEE